jgi:tRNA pseudouridine55 synthase
VIERRACAPRLAVDGVLLLDKPAGLSSQAAVTRVKTIFNAAKAGHTGTLDPMATGLLPVVFGEATKFSSALLDAGKSYLATLRLGVTTTTGDLEGEVTGTSLVALELSRIEEVLARFRGEIVQTPPMHSALKHQGRPLYEYARKGMEITRVPRRVTIEALTLVAYAGNELELAVSCSKGTYIRVLAEDIGRALGCGACLAALRRTRVGAFNVADAIALDGLAELSQAARTARLLPVDAMLSEIPVLELDEGEARRIESGSAVECLSRGGAGLVRLYGPGSVFLGVGEAGPSGWIQPRRLVAAKAPNVEKTGTYGVK